jgi:quinol monooxygenase YgiN
MSEHVSWMLTLEIRPGQEDALRALIPEMVSATYADEPGALDYEWYVSEDGTRLHLFERYEDSAATLVHLANFVARFASRFLACLKPTGFTVYGSPSAEVQAALSAMGPVFMPRAAGFCR